MKYLYVIFCTLCILACTDRYDMPRESIKRLDGRQALNNIISYIKNNDKSMGYLTERRYSAADVKSKFARYRVSGDSLWIFVPIVRYLCDSVTTVDSMRLQPKRTYAVSFFNGSVTPSELWFVEDIPTTEYHHEHEMAMWYNNLTGRQRYFNESGNLVSSKNLYKGQHARPRSSSVVDNVDDCEIDLPDVKITMPPYVMIKK